MTAPVICTLCHCALRERAAGIAIFALGDEMIESYYLCPACDQWTVEVYHDRFMGEDSVHRRGPYPRARGDADVARIRRCPDPFDKWCRCEVHQGWA